MDRNADALPARARRAYERARWLRALPVAVAIPPAASLAFLQCAQPLESVVCSVALGVLVAASCTGDRTGGAARAPDSSPEWLHSSFPS